MRILPLILFAACSPGEVRVTGVVSSYPDEKAGPLEGGTVAILTDRGDEWDTDVTDAQGRFDVMAPKGENIFAVVGGDELADASFTGVSGLDARLRVPDGTLYAVPDWQRAEWEALFDGCEGLGEGGLVIGEVHVFLPGVDPDPTTIVTTASVRVEGEDADPELTREACYLDDEGAAFDPDATETGTSGWFAVTAVDEGVQTLVVDTRITQDVSQRAFLTLYMPEGGVVPRFPTYIDFPLAP